METPPPDGQTPPSSFRRLSGSWSPTLGNLFAVSPHSLRAGLMNSAEIVVWQSSRRVIAAGILGGGALLLRLFGFVSGPTAPILVIVPAYIALVAVLTVIIERRRRVGRFGLMVLALADVAAIFTTVAYVTSPAFYPRALLLSLFALQFTQLFFGRMPGYTTVVGSVIGYCAVLFAAWMQGVGFGWAEQGWMIFIYLITAINGIVLHASANRRLAVLVDLFASAQRGDFSQTFVEEKGQEPDGITTLGHVYNHLRSELATMVHTDPLTGCLNRRGFDQLLGHTLAAASRRGAELSLLAIDIDHFKEINDTAGHLVGDSVLREITEVLVRSSRGGDVVARVGGDEFVVLLPDADSEMAGVVAERMTNSVRQHAFRTIRGRQKVSLSVGIAAEQVTDAHIAGSLRARADEALYVAKRLGRDRVVMWAPGIRSNATPPWSDFVSTVGAGATPLHNNAVIGHSVTRD